VGLNHRKLKEYVKENMCGANLYELANLNLGILEVFFCSWQDYSARTPLNRLSTQCRGISKMNSAAPAIKRLPRASSCAAQTASKANSQVLTSPTPSPLYLRHFLRIPSLNSQAFYSCTTQASDYMRGIGRHT